jgi:hypothetical protein
VPCDLSWPVADHVTIAFPRRGETGPHKDRMAAAASGPVDENGVSVIQCAEDLAGCCAICGPGRLAPGLLAGQFWMVPATKQNGSRGECPGSRCRSCGFAALPVRLVANLLVANLIRDQTGPAE